MKLKAYVSPKLRKYEYEVEVEVEVSQSQAAC